jgi:type II secretory ATPase GspE/PulE/Tfp pilus assembly ATPase PilB-like protein
MVIEKRDLQSRFWKEVFLKADEIDASDIHVENFSDALVVRCRISGTLVEIKKLVNEREFLRGMVTRLKIICRMDLSVDDEAQDRSMSLNLTKSRYRIALSPTVFGENFVFRVIKDESVPSLKDLLIPEASKVDLLDAISQKQGFICITGPTGSGKSTTLQAIIMQLDRSSKKVITIENPVERIIPEVMQKEISNKVGWKVSIKMALREDPDIILIGEIRDKESAELALEAAQTGHLVYSTLHTNDVAGIVDRLIGLGVERRLIAENLLYVSAQRLIQKLCIGCRIKTSEFRYTKGHGCTSCKQSGVPGVKGRIPIIEYSLRPTPDSVINFSKKHFSQDQLNTSLKKEITRLVNQGLVDEQELKYWH